MKKFIGTALVLCCLALPLAGCEDAISTVTSTTMSELVKNPITIVLAFDAQNCNPNGDPDNDNNPRQFEDGIGYMSSESIKYKIRSYIRDKVLFDGLEKNSHALYCSPDTFSIERSVKECLEPIIGKKTKGIPDDQQLEAYKELCRYYYDTRMFGLVNTSYSNCSLLSRIKGACQVSMPMSYDPIEIIPMTITRCCVASDAERKGEDKGAKKGVSIDESDDGAEKKTKDRMIGRRSIIRYGLYHMSIQINLSLIHI